MNHQRSKFRLPRVFAITMLLCSVGFSQNYPDTLWIPVIFYDYRGLGTNGFQPPEGEHCNWPDYAGMVANKLSSDFKPVRARPVGCSQTLNEWFRPSGANGPATNTEFYYDTADSLWKWTNLVRYNNPRFPNNRNEFVSTQFTLNNHMANIIIYDSLPFLRRPNLGEGVYQFSRTGQNEPQFFWLDGKGFGEDPPGSGHNYYFTMELHWLFTYQPGLTFEFNGDDDVWAFVNDSLVMDLGGIHEPLYGSFRVDDFASRMGLVEGSQYSFRFFYAERKTVNSTIRITTNILSPPKIRGLNITVRDTAITAGRSLPIPAQLITDDNNRPIPVDSINPLTNRPFYSDITWQLLPSTRQDGDSLTGSGASVTFTGTKAFRTRTVIATYTNPRDGMVYRDTAFITVNPGPDYKVWVEATSGTPFASANDILPRTYADSTSTNREIAQIQLDSAQQVAYAGAVVRDQYGNIKRVATNGQWEALPSPPAAVTAAPTAGRAWQGTITRVGSGVDSIRAWENNLFGDTVRVVIAAGTLLGLRIVDSLGNVVNSVTMTTDDVRLLRVQGRYSDKPNDWVAFNADWSMNPIIRSEFEMRNDASEWRFSPTEEGQANLTVSDKGNRPVTIPITVTRAPPSRVEFKLIGTTTPVAGVPFKTEVRIYNKDGLVSGRWCFPGEGNGEVSYQDVIMRIGQDGVVNTGKDSGSVNLRPNTSHTVEQCFEGGIDTVEFTLYYAPVSADSTHRLYVQLNGTGGRLEASTDPFRLLPGPVDRIQIGNTDCQSLPSSITLRAPGDVFYGVTCGWDPYGNFLGQVPSIWTKDGTLPDISPEPKTVLYFDTKTMTNRLQGCIIATAQANSAARDTVCLEIIPQSARAVAVTRDVDGNGYLDGLILHFSRPVPTPAASAIQVTFRERTEVFNFPVTSVTPVGGGATDTVFFVTLQELENNRPQTGWTPSVTITAQDIDPAAVVALDGAGPVIWRVVKEVKSVTDRTQDVVTITLSEPVTRSLTPADDVNQLLNAWRGPVGQWVEDAEVLDGLKGFDTPRTPDRRIATFRMFNQANLTGEHFLNIDSTRLGPEHITDAAGNRPNLNNRRAPVEIVGMPMIVNAGPVPFPVTRMHQEQNANLQYLRAQTAGRWALDNGGVAFAITIPLSTDETQSLTGSLSVYDLAGNLVHRRRTAPGINLIEEAKKDDPSFWKPGLTREIGIYWNGINDKGMPVKPGVYRAVVDFVLKDKSSESRLREPISLGVRL